MYMLAEQALFYEERALDAKLEALLIFISIYQSLPAPAELVARIKSARRKRRRFLRGS